MEKPSLTPPPPSRPWYRFGGPWLLILGPVAAIVAGIFTVWIAASNTDGTVDDDYAKSGNEINMDLSRDNKAASLGLSASLTLGNDNRSVRMVLQGYPDTPPGRLRLTLHHPTRADLDQFLELDHAGNSIYQGELAAPVSAKRLVSVEDAKNGWRLHGVWQIEKYRAIILDSSGKK